MKLFETLHDLKGYNGHNSLRWFYKIAGQLGLNNDGVRESVIKDAPKKVSKLQLGKMYLYEYDPKWKDKLPYWDRFPLIFVLNADADGFLALNLHYLGPQLRLAFFNKLNEFASDTRLSPKSKLLVQYKLISDMSKFPETSVCIKRYLWSHVRTKFMEIPATDWRNAVLLPLQSFQKKTSRSVWLHSLNAMKKSK